MLAAPKYAVNRDWPLTYTTLGTSIVNGMLAQIGPQPARR